MTYRFSFSQIPDYTSQESSFANYSRYIFGRTVIKIRIRLCNPQSNGRWFSFCQVMSSSMWIVISGCDRIWARQFVAVECFAAWFGDTKHVRRGVWKGKKRKWKYNFLRSLFTKIEIYLLFSANILSYKILTHFTPGTFSNVTLKMLTPIFEKINVVYVLEIPVSRLC